ncbi:hypothetical protein NA78x_003645 [Anatilimnocola sp. NA78]|uniref:hypothetical protein n=1 Tax=Anatilimnocola sp. NA78 TaxID=3415683 RepID=UPI003CE47B36
MSQKLEPPTETALDHGHKVMKLGVSLIPYAGGPASEILSWIIEAPIQKRLHEWRMSIGEEILRIHNRQESFIDDLQNNPNFIDTVLQASQAALRTSQQEKREALKNAVLNTALPNSPDEWERTMFIHYVESLSVWHLRLLRLLSEPLAWFRERGITPPEFHIAGS